jgi:pimeloyl-ACP methyl ester carboxylesterase
MPYFNSDGLRIHYLDQGAGAPVVLVQGFASNADLNWASTGWVGLLAAHYRVIAPDCRGHGASDKPQNRQEYTTEKIGGDVIRLLDRLGVARTLLMGYSMGARICLGLLLSHPERLRAVVLGGFGMRGTPTGAERRKAIVGGLLAQGSLQIRNQTARFMREFAEAHRNDLQALAACMDADRTPMDPDRLGAVRVPVMLVAGSDDRFAVNVEGLRRMIAGARLLKLAGRNHLNAPADPLYKESVLKFFAEAPR